MSFELFPNCGRGGKRYTREHSLFNKFLKLKNQGLGYTAIGKRFHRSRCYVYSILKYGKERTAKMRKIKECDGCGYIEIKNGIVTWSGIGHPPCHNCERNQPIIKDNFTKTRREMR